MTFDVNITAAFDRAVASQVEPIMEKTLNELTEIIVEEFSEPKSGRIYRRPIGGFYRASAPGEPPAIRTGKLRDSISKPQVGRSGRSVVGRIVIAAPYAEGLERGRGLVAPRPFVAPAIEELLGRRV